MENIRLKWIYLIALSLVWGSSFILMKYALVGMKPVHVGALRILITALFLVLIAYKSVFGLTKKHWFYLSLNALLGTFFPAFLFAFAIDKMDSSIAAILNSFTPFNTLIIGALLFGYSFHKKQITGIVIGLFGTIMLILNGDSFVLEKQELLYPSFILIASVGYAINVNIIKKHLQDVKAIAITTGNFILLIIPSILVLVFSDFFANFQFTPQTNTSLVYIIILAIVGTAIAKTFFNKLVQISSPIFSTSVTYLIPIVAVFWGLFDGENITTNQMLSGLVILLGVYLVNKKR